jgi:hypothetical protein
MLRRITGGVTMTEKDILEFKIAASLVVLLLCKIAISLEPVTATIVVCCIISVFATLSLVNNILKRIEESKETS